jgi:hypothetical protein
MWRNPKMWKPEHLTNLAESSKRGYGSETAVLPIIAYYIISKRNKSEAIIITGCGDL